MLTQIRLSFSCYWFEIYLSISTEGVLSFDSAPDYDSDLIHRNCYIRWNKFYNRQNLTISVNDLNDEVPYIWDESRQSYPWSYSPQAYAIKKFY